MRVGDCVKRTAWWAESNKWSHPNYGIILELHLRDAENYTQAEIEAEPIRTITVMQACGKIKKWYAIHVEVISETG